MNKYKSPFKHFDMTTTHLPEDGDHYIPAPTRDSTERDRRHAMPHNSLILEDQRSGLTVAKHVIGYDFQNPEEQSFAFNTLVPTLLNTSYYSAARGAGDVMRRRLELPILADDEGEWRETQDGLLHKIREAIGHTVTLAEQIELQHKRGLRAESLRQQLGRHAGSVALALACYDLGEAPYDMSDFDIQSIVRLRALDTIQQSRQFMPHGTYGSVAQLAHPHSLLSLHYLRHAPHSGEAASIFAGAQEDFGLSA